MQVQKNVSLKLFNSFGISANAEFFASIKSIEELLVLLDRSLTNEIFVLGGGSNILLTKDVKGLVVKNEFVGIEKIKEDDTHVYVKAGAGELWHNFVLHCIRNDWSGVENLSLIPGSVGASPIQNIGAYGMEIKDVFYELTAFHLKEKSTHRFSASDCAFGYRDSVFKQKYRNQYLILDVTFKLAKQPTYKISYGAIEQELKIMQVHELSIKAISDAVIAIRSSKLPNPKEIGNAGSFFKNPEIATKKYETLKNEFPLMVGYELPNKNTKLAAGWLIEQCGWKGFRRGDVGCHAKQALVLLNFGNAKGADIYQLSEEILQSVYEKFGVMLEREVNIL